MQSNSKPHPFVDHTVETITVLQCLLLNMVGLNSGIDEVVHRQEVLWLIDSLRSL